MKAANLSSVLLVGNVQGLKIPLLARRIYINKKRIADFGFGKALDENDTLVAKMGLGKRLYALIDERNCQSEGNKTSAETMKFS